MSAEWKEVRNKFENGQEIFRRPSVALLLYRIAELEEQVAAQPAGEAVCAECGRPATGHDKIGVRHAFTPSR